jgi:hypothetical protein
MLFGVKNGPPTYQRIFGQFYEDFLDDFIVYSDMENHCKSLNYVFKSAKNMAFV